MKLIEILSPDVIKIGLTALEKNECFEELIDLLYDAKKITDKERALKAIHAREDMRSTGIGKGVAVPHGKDESIKTIVAAAGTSKDGIEFDAIDGQPVHLVFLVLAENNNPGPHLQTLSEIATCLNVPGLQQKLVNAKTPQEFMSILAQLDTEAL